MSTQHDLTTTAGGEWELSDSASLLVCWKETPDKDPFQVEGHLLRQFKDHYGCEPYANPGRPRNPCL